jgi:hypothetical protein
MKRALLLALLASCSARPSPWGHPKGSLTRWPPSTPQSVEVANPHAAFNRARRAMDNLGLNLQVADRSLGILTTEWTSRAAGCGEMFSCPKGHIQIRYRVVVTKTQATVSIQSRKGYRKLEHHPATEEALRNQEFLAQALADLWR